MTMRSVRKAGPPARPTVCATPLGGSPAGFQNTPIQIFIIENRLSRLTVRLTATMVY